jgi:hypothetical protein
MRRSIGILNLAAAAALTLATSAPPLAAQTPPNLLEARQQLEARYAQSLEELAGWCEAQGLTEQATQTRRAARPRDPWTLYLVNLQSAETIHDGADPRVRQWRERFAALGRHHAEGLLTLARQAMRARHPSLAYELVLEMVRADPSSEEGRKLLGFIKYKGEWRTPFEVDKLKARYVWHERFGWLPQAHVARYESGERYYNGRWITAEEEAQIRGDIRSAWHVQTEHYSIRTNHSLEAGVALGQKLERLYRAWQQTFAPYYASPDQLLRLFEGRSPNHRSSGPRHLVMHFRDRQQYLQALEGHVPPGVVTTGIYLGDYRTAYFYATEDADSTTFYHEASHQLFSECREVAPNVGLRGNFWIIEGIACYLESFRPGAEYDLLGGTDSPRLEAARRRALVDQFYVPLDQFVLYGMNDLQRDRRIAMLYSQAAGLAHFLMHYDDGRYRDALMSYLEAVYTGEDTPQTLAQLTGKSYVELDREYHQFLEELPRRESAAANNTAADQQSPPK